MKTYIAAIIFGAIGSIFMVGSTLKLIGRIFFLRSAQTAIGTIVGLQMKYVRTSRRQRTVYLPVVEFRPANARRAVRITGTVGASPPDYQIGDSVAVRFPVERPAGSKIDSFWEMWAVPFICFAVGALVLTVAILVFFESRRLSLLHSTV